MKFTKIILAVLAICFFANLGTAQSEKMMMKAKEKTEKLNALIKAGNGEALSAEQMATITKLNAAKMKEVRQVKKGEGTAEEIDAAKKAVNKNYGKQINALLTKEQRMAKKAARAAAKG